MEKYNIHGTELRNQRQNRTLHQYDDAAYVLKTREYITTTQWKTFWLRIAAAAVNIAYAYGINRIVDANSHGNSCSSEAGSLTNNYLEQIGAQNITHNTPTFGEIIALIAKWASERCNVPMPAVQATRNILIQETDTTTDEDE